MAEAIDDWELEADEDEATSNAHVETSTNGPKSTTVANPPETQKQTAVEQKAPTNAATEDASSDDDDDDSGEDDDDDDDAEQNHVLTAYHRLLSRRVDLVGDYAGTELFLIDGDSLLLRAFEDENLDFDAGFQLLHAVYNVEHFLHALIQRKCNFNIAFADTNEELCIPTQKDQSAKHKYRFARSAIIRHLTINLAKSHPEIAVNRFESYASEEFATYLDQTSPYFVMLHDGAEAGARKGKHLESLPGDVSTSTKISLRSTILHFIARGYNVALLNGLEWRDTKVMTMVLEEKRRGRQTLQVSLPSCAAPSKTQKFDIAEGLSRLNENGSSLGESRALSILTIAALLQNTQPASEDLVRQSCTFLAHQALLMHTAITSRRLPSVVPSRNDQDFIALLSATADSILNHEPWDERLRQKSNGCDLADFIDGRLLVHMLNSSIVLDVKAHDSLNNLLSQLEKVIGTRPDYEPSQAASPKTSPPPADAHRVDSSVWPFSNPVFDKHLSSVKLEADEHAANVPSPVANKIFRELTHWHNVKRPIAPKAPVVLSRKDKFYADRRNQRFMAEMRTYAASLTNAVGKSLEPETVIEGTGKAKASSSTNKKGTSSPADSDLSDAASTKSKAGKGGGGKNAAKAAGKDAMLKQIALERAKKNDAASGKIASAWKIVCNGFETDKDPRSRYRRAKNYLTGLQSTQTDIVGAEIQLYMLNELILVWISCCRAQRQHDNMEVLALMWDSASKIMLSNGLNDTVAQCVDLAVKTLNLPPLPQAKSKSAPDRKLAFTFALPTKAPLTANELPSKQFQLTYCGPYLERTFDSAPDERVDFHPDGWQRRVLDALDKEESVFVVAPTSAGKTFISFYAMKQVLERDSEGVIVYVAPTKALVNQIAAEIQARYSKNYKYGGKSVWGIHTRDYRINNPTGCQVLVTVPHVLQIMLLAPSNANGWSSRIRRIIFDEVHSIGQAEDGVVWEQLLLLAPCPIVALSATVGNPEEFSGWLGSTQSAIGQKLVTVEHPHRYSDLRKYFYSPPKQFAFTGLPEKSSFGTLSLDGVPDFNFVHPVGGLVDKTRGIPKDLGLEPRDCLLLWQSMVKHQNDKYWVDARLDPKIALPDVARKADILAWEGKLKAILKEWIKDNESPYDEVVKDLGRTFRDEQRGDLQISRGDAEVETVHLNPENVKETTLPMLCRLEAQDALPAILFNYDRHDCEHICMNLLEQLQQSETAQVKSGKKWQKTLEQWEEWKKIQAKAAAKKPKAASKKGSKDEDEERESKLDLQRDAGAQDSSAWESFDPDAPQPGYHFADHSKAQNSELQIYIRQLGRRNVPQYLIDGLARGIGVHHAGMNRKYRQVVEILFRKRFLRVVIATGTLALGINMPAKTVVFSGDSVFLTALNYRQCAGRAGRRGFDLLGNVVFQGVPRQKVCRLLSSRLPDLNGHFPITTTLVLRLFTLLHESKQSKYAVSAINALLSQPRLYLGGPSFKEATMHHLRFSIEYLRRQHLLDAHGAPLNFAGLVSHLYFTENSAFAFHALAKGGYFHELCANVQQHEKTTLETLMLVMAHMFSRVYCRSADEEFKQKVVKPSSSMVFLPPLPEKAAQILREHNQQTLELYQNYVETFVDQHIHDPDDRLPTTGVSFGSSSSNSQLTGGLAPVQTRSPFVALSGAGDEFASIHDLCSTTRAGVFLEEAVIPYIPVYPESEHEAPLNAWLLDFFKHGDVFTLEKANGIRRADVWFMLNDFSLVLATIVTSLQNFMKLNDGDMDMLDVMGDFDTHEEEKDDQVAADEAGSDISGPSAADSGIVLPEAEQAALPVRGKKSGRHAESWEDVADAETAADDRALKRQEIINSQAQADLEAAAAGLKDEGLKDVLLAFQKLHAELMIKFKAMWA